MSKAEDGQERQKNKGFKHLKWPAIIILILILLLIIFLDRLYRQGNL